MTAYGDLDDDWLPLIDRDTGDFVGLETLQRVIEALPKLAAWSSLCRALDRCHRSGLGSFIDAVLQGSLKPSRIADCYRFTLLERVAEDTIWRSPVLSDFSRSAMEKARHRFQELDRLLLETNRQLVAYQVSQKRPPLGNARGRVGEFSELGLVRHEIGKQRRHCRIRDLLSRAGKTVQTLKPCFMMSPLSVAQFLAPDGLEFDLVIMDEASQIKPEDALGTVLRAKQIVVVGDPKQLPPTSFFERIGDDDEDDSQRTQFDDTESILEAAMKALQPVRRLRWHYRSRHEKLIQFSNERFYDGDLVVFPSPAGAGLNLGLRYHFVDGGFFDGGCNHVEAAAVAEAIVRHAKTNPHESLGVGAFNLKHSILIQDCLDRLCQQDAAARVALDRLNSRDQSLFIKNLENLQGDERDVIFISYTYGPDSKSGRVMNRFGPLALENGWRRLNVLITRARKRVEVFTTMRPTEILGGPGKGRGVNAMRDYLEFCRTGELPDRVIVDSGREIQSPFEEAVARVITDMGLEIVPQVGVAGYFIDLGILRPGHRDEFLLGIECDGAAYHSAKSARDRDRLREEVIRSRGWHLHRIWSTDWYLNQRHEQERLITAIQCRLAEIEAF